MSERRRLLASEIALPEIEQWVIEASEGTQHEEYGCVGGRGVNCGGDIGDANVVGSAVGDVALVIAGSWKNTRVSTECNSLTLGNA